MEKIYIVMLNDYDRNDIWGCFTDYDKAKGCCDYLNATCPSHYEGFEWEMDEYGISNTDYSALLKEHEEQQRQIAEAAEEKVRQTELAELARLKAKYEGV